MDGSECVYMFIEMFGVVSGVAIRLECFFVFVKPYLEASASLTHISFVAIGAFQFVHSGLGVYIWCLLFVF